MPNFVSSPIFNIFIAVYLSGLRRNRDIYSGLHCPTYPTILEDHGPHISKILSVIFRGNKNIFALTIDPVTAIASFSIADLYVRGPLGIRFACFPYSVRDCLQKSFYR